MKHSYSMLEDRLGLGMDDSVSLGAKGQEAEFGVGVNAKQMSRVQRLSLAGETLSLEGMNLVGNGNAGASHREGRACHPWGWGSSNRNLAGEETSSGL